MTLGAVLKAQVSALNEVGESLLSPSSMLTFANVPDAPASLTLSPSASDEVSSITIAWAAPTSLNGDSIASYKIYLDNGRGGPFTLIYEGTPSSYSYVAGVEESLDCGYLYMVRVSATNVAGEGSYIAASTYLGNVPSNPKTPLLVSVVPNTSLTLSWIRPDDDGCLSILNYRVNKDGQDLDNLIQPTATTFTDDISVGGAIGTEIVYKVKAVNVNGDSLYSEELTVIVGLVPNPP